MQKHLASGIKVFNFYIHTHTYIHTRPLCINDWYKLVYSSGKSYDEVHQFVSRAVSGKYYKLMSGSEENPVTGTTTVEEFKSLVQAKRLPQPDKITWGECANFS